MPTAKDKDWQLTMQDSCLMDKDFTKHKPPSNLVWRMEMRLMFLWSKSEELISETYFVYLCHLNYYHLFQHHINQFIPIFPQQPYITAPPSPQPITQIYFEINNIKIKKRMKKVKISDFQILTTLGVGTFGRVRLVKHKNTNKFYAAKILKKMQILKSKQIDHVQSQVKILSSISHPFIVNMEGFAQDARYLYFILEFVSGGELLTYLRNNVRFESSQAAIYAAQIVLIFEYLHDKNIIFRDLKPQNLLIAEDGYLKLTDFSFAKTVQLRTYTLCGTPQYLAPQIILNTGHGKAVDWWTLGILIYEMNAGIDPFTDQDPMIIYQNILKGKVRFPKDMDREAKSIIKYFLVADPSKRLGMLKNGVEDVKQHKWLSKIDMRQLLAKKIPMTYKPTIKFPGDTSNFNQYQDSDNLPPPVKQGEDPFTDW